MNNNDNIKRLPDAELEIMKELWAADEPLTRPQLEQRPHKEHPLKTTLPPGRERRAAVERVILTCSASAR